jgi:hypothetical protein
MISRPASDKIFTRRDIFVILSIYPAPDLWRKLYKLTSLMSIYNLPPSPPLWREAVSF